MKLERIGNYIAKKRKKREFTQEQLGEKLGVSYQAVSKWERGENLPDSYL
ncbi:helix-turn-helix transcriptional regulator [Mycoplasmatota bacterium WC44]